MENIKEKTVTLNDLGFENDSGYVLLIHNDDITPFEYVIYVLTEICEVSIDESMRIAMTAHSGGKAVVKNFDSEEEAKQMQIQINSANKEFGYNLVTSIEEE